EAGRARRPARVRERRGRRTDPTRQGRDAMNERERLRVLRATPHFADVNDARLRSLLPFIDELCVRAGSTLAQEGRLCHQFVIVASGFLETCLRGKLGNLRMGDSIDWSAIRDIC